MGYTTFANAKEWVSKGYGDCTDAVTAEVVNAIREHFYNWYTEVRLFLDAIECFQVRSYCVECNDCSNTYRGITLPRESQNVEAMWLNDWPIRVHDSWREYQQGITPFCECHLSSMIMPGGFSTFDDITPGTAQELHLVALDPADAGKRVLVRGVDSAARNWTESIELATEPRKTSVAFRSIDARGGIVKEVTQGRVLLMDKFGRVYGRYEPDETVPSYRRVKINGLGESVDVVNVRSARRFFPLYGAMDVVETDNRMAFDAMARYLRNYRKVEKTREILVSEKNDLATARGMILGAKARDEGATTQADVRIASPVFRGRTLNRFG